MLWAVLRWGFDALVELNATFLAAVLSHESVQNAGARMMVRAMNDFLRQGNLHEHVRIASENMAVNQEDYARSAGQDFPKLAGQFIQGMLSPKKPGASGTTGTRPLPDKSVTEVTVTAPPKENLPRVGNDDEREDVTPTPVLEKTNETLKKAHEPPKKTNPLLNIPILVEGGLRHRPGSGTKPSTEKTGS